MELILTTAVTLFIVLDPFGNLAVFHSVLSTCPEEKRTRILMRELLIALFILFLFLFFGEPMLSFLALKQPTLKISGGVILFLISLGMVFPKKNIMGDEVDDEPFIVPLAVPLVAGPSALILILVFAHQHSGKIGQIAAATFLAWLFAAFILLASPLFMRILGRKGTRALERLMGMLLVMISVQMFLDGLAEYVVVR